MTLRDECLPIFEDVRILLDDLGFRRYDILLRVIDWAGGTVGKGAKTTLDTPLVIQGNGATVPHRIKVRRITSQDILASGGKYQDGDYRIGPMTPVFVNIFGLTGGNDVNYFNPEKSLTTKREFYYRLTGPGMELGKWFKKIDQVVDTNWSYYFTLRADPTSDP